MLAADQIRDLERRVELLAPAGRRDVLRAVLEAGADAVYLSTRRFNMRMHRPDFHFSVEDLGDAVAMVHDMGRRIYVTVNAIFGERELHDVGELLAVLQEMGVDAVIVQDLATIHLARQRAPGLSLHASTMMNVHHAEQARVLKSLGIRRIITSRDITLQEIGEIGRVADIEVECFAHGDMCVAQSGQCSMSGVLFGKSANRGQCMKPCRWSYELVRQDTNDSHGSVHQGHLLAIKDLCLIRNVPDVVQAGITSMKIEGRMRDSEYLRHIVATYREAIDTYYDNPPSYSLRSDITERVFRSKVRSLSTLRMLDRSPDRELFDPEGRREPLFLSDGCREPDMQAHLDMIHDAPSIPAVPRHRIELAVSVADEESARAAIDGGADRIYLAAEMSQRPGSTWSMGTLDSIIHEADRRGVGVGLRTPRITTANEWAETRWMLQRALDHKLDTILAHHPGTLELARKTCPAVRILADYGFNVVNSGAVRVLQELGACQATLSNEAGLADLADLAASSPLPLEVIAHGPVSGMILDHCLIAMYINPQGQRGMCRGPCRHVSFGLKDRFGEVRPIVADQHCRNHLLSGHDLATLPILEKMLWPTVHSIRVEGQFYDPPHVHAITSAYALRLKRFREGSRNGTTWQRAWQRLLKEAPRPLNLGPYVHSIVSSRSTAAVMKELVQE